MNFAVRPTHPVGRVTARDAENPQNKPTNQPKLTRPSLVSSDNVRTLSPAPAHASTFYKEQRHERLFSMNSDSIPRHRDEVSTKPSFIEPETATRSKELGLPSFRHAIDRFEPGSIGSDICLRNVRVTNGGSSNLQPRTPPFLERLSIL